MPKDNLVFLWTAAICKQDWRSTKIKSPIIIQGLSGKMISLVFLQFPADVTISLKWNKREHKSVSGVMVSIVAFQAVDRGSIPRWRKHFFCSILGWSIVWFIHPSTVHWSVMRVLFCIFLRGTKTFYRPCPTEQNCGSRLYSPVIFCKNWKKFGKNVVRSGIWTHAHICGPEFPWQCMLP